MKYVLIMLIQFSLATAASAADPCNQCDQLKNVEVQYRAKNKTSDYYNSLQLKASELISKMADQKSRKLTQSQVVRVAEVIQLSTEHDPSESILQNSLDVIAANKDSLKKQFDKFPKKRAEELKSAVDLAVHSLEEGNDPETPAKD
jgi:hypothetical protein